MKYAQIVLLLSCLLSIITCSDKAEEAIPTIAFQNEEKLEDISFRGASIEFGMAIISGTKGSVYKAKLSEQQWKRLTIPEGDSLDFRDVAILDEQTILAMSVGSGDKSRIYKSTDQGQGWQMVYQNEEPKAFFNGFDFWDEQRGILVSDAIDEKLYILKTEDGGLHWSRVGEGSLPPLFEGEYGFAASGTGIKTLEGGIVHIVTGGANARLFSSSDYGKTWNVIPVLIRSGNASSGIFSVDFFNSKLAIAVGGDYNDDQNRGGNIAITNDAMTWFLPESGDSLRFLSCTRFLHKDLILATGTSGTVLLRQKEQKWTFEDLIDGYHTAAYDNSANLGVIAGGNGRVRWFSIR